MTKQPVFALIDCNNFFVSCERVFRPDLWDKPVAVLSNNDGCVVARSNEVKALGVPMAVPLFKVQDIMNAHKVTLFSANFRLYGDFSQRVVQILEYFCPRIEVYSVDESFAEISDLPTTDYETWARGLREAVLQWTGIPVSVGVGPTKTLAKAAADHAKKYTSTGVFMADERFLHEFPVGSVWGVGWRTAPKLLQRGISTAHHLSQVTDKWALENLTIRGLKTVKELRGESCLPLEKNGEPQKTIARTRSFGHNVRDFHQLEGAVATFAAQAAAKLRDQKEIATGILVFLRTSKHNQTQHGASALVKLTEATADTGALIGAAMQALTDIYDQDFAYKKAGVVLVGLTTMAAWQLSMFGQGPAKLDRQKDLMTAVDSLNQKYNTRLVRHASEQVRLSGWHSKREKRSPAYTTDWSQLPVVRAR